MLRRYLGLLAPIHLSLENHAPHHHFPDTATEPERLWAGKNSAPRSRQAPAAVEAAPLKCKGHREAGAYGRHRPLPTPAALPPATRPLGAGAYSGRRQGERQLSAEGPPLPSSVCPLQTVPGVSVSGHSLRPARAWRRRLPWAVNVRPVRGKWKNSVGEGGEFLPALRSAGPAVECSVAERAASPAVTGAGHRRALVCGETFFVGKTQCGL